MSLDFVTMLPVLTNWKGETYNSIFVIVNGFMKIVYYKQVKVTIDASWFAGLIIAVIVRHYGLPYFIVTDQGLVFILKF